MQETRQKREIPFGCSTQIEKNRLYRLDKLLLYGVYSQYAPKIYFADVKTENKRAGETKQICPLNHGYPAMFAFLATSWKHVSVARINKARYNGRFKHTG